MNPGDAPHAFRGGGKEKSLLIGGHFGESIGTFAQIQFFHEPSSLTQADAEADGTCAAPL